MSQFREYSNEPLTATLLHGDGESSPSGFRVWYGSWTVTASQMDESEAADFCLYLSKKPDLPAPPEVIASCRSTVTIYSAVDAPAYDNVYNFQDFLGRLRMRFGSILWDNYSGEWRT